ncbi:MAG: DUF4292 domain-containing protein, partial [Ignavibacteria bacterium]|nr:DUF4292 domain-containing protein [Ignavibacteria bacterium]
MKTFKYAVLIFTIIYFSSCVPTKKITYSLPVERIIERIEENSKSIQVFEADGTVSVDSKDFSNSANFDLTIKKPDSLGLNIIGPFGIDVASAVASKEKLIFFNQIAYQVIYANPNRDNLKKILRVNLEFSDLLDIFTGNFDFSNIDKSKLTYTTEADYYLLSIDNKDTKVIEVKYPISKIKKFVEKYKDCIKIIDQSKDKTLIKLFIKNSCWNDTFIKELNSLF